MQPACLEASYSLTWTLRPALEIHFIFGSSFTVLFITVLSGPYMLSRTRSRLFTWKLWLEGRQELSGILLWKTGMSKQGARQLGLWGNKKVVLTEARSAWQRSAALRLGNASYAPLLHYNMPGAHKAFWDRCNCSEDTTTDLTQANGLDRVNRGLSPEKEREMQN